MDDQDIWAAARFAEEEEILRQDLLSVAQVVLDADEPDKALVQVAKTLPGLREAPGLSPWNVDECKAWTLSEACTTSGYWSALFVLSVWEREAELCDSVEAAQAWEDAGERWVLDELLRSVT